MLKVITGSVKGKNLKSLEGDATRPTSERIKEAMFSSIQFDIEGRRVLDVYAGSGQLGIEALSRGAESCTFIDSSREAMEIVKTNVKLCGFDSVCKYLVSDARNYIRKASGRSVFDLVFIDPPYKDASCTETLVRLASGGMLADGAIAVLESGEEAIDLTRLSDFEVSKSKSYGKKTTLTILFYRKPKMEENV